MLASRKVIHLFAKVWLDRLQKNAYRSSAFFIQDFTEWFGEECRLLGFEMDCGQKFLARLEEDKQKNPEKSLEELISNIYNWEVLGSGLFSRWRYITHWASSSPSEEVKHYTPWLILVLRQLKKSTAPSHDKK
jgi:hypothetical protein